MHIKIIVSSDFGVSFFLVWPQDGRSHVHVQNLFL